MRFTQFDGNLENTWMFASAFLVTRGFGVPAFIYHTEASGLCYVWHNRDISVHQSPSSSLHTAKSFKRESCSKKERVRSVKETLTPLFGSLVP